MKIPMKILVKSHLNRYDLYQEPEHRFLGQIRKRLRGGLWLEILDAAGNQTASIRQEQDFLLITDSRKNTSVCALEYQRDAAGKKTGNSLVRPPMPERLSLSIPQGEVCLIQTPRRDFKFFLNGQEAGEILHMLGITKEIHLLSDSFPSACCGILFALAFLMLHDDDIILI